MSISVNELDALSRDEAAALFSACCGSKRWTSAMIARRPFGTLESVLHAADEEWQRLAPSDWREAFAHHPRIGEVRAASRVAATAQGWSAGEQARAASADEQVKESLAGAQREYEARFGHIFLICATGKTAEQILAAVHARMGNDPDTELRVAAEEQRRITRLRLMKAVSVA
jgi:2-oxo-4-hydroxy-4-carboxy-5-ureidoimidazoline decarboxylase